jgi:hypothetical protein
MDWKKSLEGFTPRNRPWTRKEIEIVQYAIEKGYPARALMKILPGRTHKAISIKIDHEKLTRSA